MLTGNDKRAKMLTDKNKGAQTMDIFVAILKAILLFLEIANH